MTSDALLVLQTVFVTIWTLFTSWTIPGTNTTPAEFSLFILVFALVLRTVKRLLNNGGDES